jgi:hypothetical protein
LVSGSADPVEDIAWQDQRYDAPKVNYQRLGLEVSGYDFLYGRPQSMVDYLVRDLFAAGLRIDEIQELLTGILSPIVRFRPLHKSDDRAEEIERKQRSLLHVLIHAAKIEAASIVQPDLFHSGSATGPLPVSRDVIVDSDGYLIAPLHHPLDHNRG